MRNLMKEKSFSLVVGPFDDMANLGITLGRMTN